MYMCLIDCWRNNGNAFRTHDNKTTTAAAATPVAITTKTIAAMAATAAAAEAAIQFQFIIKFAIFSCFVAYIEAKRGEEH